MKVARGILLDAGPLIAAFDERDAHHAACFERLRTLHAPLVTTWPVLTEVAYFLRRDPRKIDALFRFADQPKVIVRPLEADAVGWVRQFLDRYASLGPQVADASLVYFAELLDLEAILTLDRRDFSAYRKRNGTALRIVPGLGLSRPALTPPGPRPRPGRSGSAG